MNSPLTVAAYQQLLHAASSDREEDGFDTQDFVQQTLGLGGLPSNRFEALKAAVRRKRKRPTTLTPLDSPQHSSRAIGGEPDNVVEETRDENTSEAQPASTTMPTLPPLAVNVLQRKKLFLSPNGEPVVGVEEILQLQELRLSPPKRPSPLQLIAVPRKVFEEDEVALMPCHTLHYRYVPSLDVERWKEPVRDRDKNWRDDELHMILATLGSMRESHKFNKMTRMGPGNVRKGTWRRLDSQRLQVKTATTRLPSPPIAVSTISETSVVTARDPALPTEILLRSQGAMISRTYCIVTIYGIGIYGRLYSEGLDERRGRDRYLKIDAYDPLTCRVMSLRVSMTDLEWIFEAQPELLAAGKKQAVLKKVVSLLFFKYPEDDNPTREDDDSPDETELKIKTKPPPAPKVTFDEPLSYEDTATKDEVPVPVLCISPDEKMNEAARRRLEREERLRREEQERLRLLALLMKMPRRTRHRVVFQLQFISGYEFLVSIYHFPNQVRNFLVVAYNPRTSRTLTIAVGVMEAAAISRIFTMPHKWTPEQKQQIAEGLLPKLHLRAMKSKAIGVTQTTTEDGLYRVALAIREDRMGAQGPLLTLALPSHSDSRKDTAIEKFKKDGQQELQLGLDAQLQEIHSTTSSKVEKLSTDIAHAEATIAALQRRDAELKEQIEDINSGKGIPLETATHEGSASQTREKAQHHEARRGFKAARKTIKDESKALQARIVAWKKEMVVTKEHAIVETEKVETKFTKSVELLTQKAMTATLPLWFDPRDRKEPLKQSQRNGSDQRSKLHRAEIRTGWRSLASGACRALGRAYRYSVFAEHPKPVPPTLSKKSTKKSKAERQELVVGTTEDPARQDGGVSEREAETTATSELAERNEGAETEARGGSDDEVDDPRKDDANKERSEVVIEEEGKSAEGAPINEETETEEVVEAGEEEDYDDDEDDDVIVPADEPVEFGDPVRWLEIVLYDAIKCERLVLRLTRLEFICFTKTEHETLLKIAALDIATSPAVQRMRELDAAYEAMRSEMVALKRLKKNEKKRKQMVSELTKNRHERRVLNHDGASWRLALNALCRRLRRNEDVALDVDRCIYRDTLSVVALGTSSESGEGDDVVDCEVWVTQLVDTVSFHARDLATNEDWTLEYPDSPELVKEFAVESPLELQLHIEAIAMTLLLYTDDSESDESSENGGKGRRKMRFEE